MFDIQNIGDAYTLGVARDAERRASEWEAYAHMLEQQLKVAKAEQYGFAAVRDAAIGELKKLDPRNYLMVQQNRRNIFDHAKDAQLKGKRTA